MVESEDKLSQYIKEDIKIDIELGKRLWKPAIINDSTETEPRPGHRFISNKCIDCKQHFFSAYKTCQAWSMK